MHVAILTLLLAVQAPQPTQPDVQELRTWLRQAFLDAATQVDEFKQKTKERFGLEPRRPRTGLEMSTTELAADESGHPIRHTMVSGVIAGSPADKAGIKPGDRIAAIGSEDLDHEKGNAVLLYLSNYEAAIPLTIETAGVARKVSLVRTPLPCLQTAFDRFPEARWLGIWNQSQTLLRDEAKLLENPTLTLKDLEESHRGLQAMMLLWDATFRKISQELDVQSNSACTVNR